MKKLESEFQPRPKIQPGFVHSDGPAAIEDDSKDSSGAVQQRSHFEQQDSWTQHREGRSLMPASYVGTEQTGASGADLRTDEENEVADTDTFFLMDYPLNVAQQNIDTRIQRALSLLTISVDTEEGPIELPITAYKYFKVIKKAGDPNGGESENEIQLYVFSKTPGQSDDDIVVAMRIAGRDVLSGRFRVSAEILNASSSKFTVRWGRSREVMPAPRSEPLEVRFDLGTQAPEDEPLEPVRLFGSDLDQEPSQLPARIYEIIGRLTAFQSYRNQTVHFPGTWNSEIYPFFFERTESGNIRCFISVGWRGFDDEGVVILEATQEELNAGKARITLLNPAANIRFVYLDPDAGPKDISGAIDNDRKGFVRLRRFDSDHTLDAMA